MPPFRLDTVNRVLGHLVEDALYLAPGDAPGSLVDALKVLQSELFRGRDVEPLPAPPAGALATSRFAIVLEHIEDNLASDVSLRDLASLMGLSVSRFSSAFKAAFGVAPYRYILDRRIAKAKAMLRNSNATIGTVSKSVGFLSQSRFAQSFARSAGVTPSAYRFQRSAR